MEFKEPLEVPKGKRPAGEIPVHTSFFKSGYRAFCILNFVPVKVVSSHLCIVFHPVLHGRNASDLFEGRPESFCVGVSNFVHHFVHIFTGRFQAHLGSFDLDALNVFNDRVGGGLFESALQIPPA